MANNPRPSLGATLLGATREAVIGLLFSEPAEPLHVREIARRTGFAAPTVARELRILAEAGVLLFVESGRQLRYRPDPACPLYPELCSIAIKTWGIRGRLATALQPIPGIQVAFIFGSIAAGTADASSDVDVLVIGDADFGVLRESLSSVEQVLGRPVSAKLYRLDEWVRKRDGTNSFIASVIASPRLFLIGSESELDGLGKPGKARGKRPARPPPRRA
ncbi:MAG TPA: nucleotidyltransferase domain-containing protein [Usitatibacteraceae bacterium]|nr:nucleotidyltransferase domain-containing protein [Usitatibacteraceae bacterium]